MTDWQLGIDFGTSYTVAAVAQEGTVAVVDVESNGRSRIPSSVFLTQDGEILVGTAAQHQAVFAPERFEPTPKRSLGETHLFLGDGLVPVTDLVAAVLRRVYAEACRQQGERAPSRVHLTHPAQWTETRLSVLRESIDKAQLGEVTLVAEPVAAAARIARESTEPGQCIAVYDFGGGTFDAAVLLRTPAGFSVAGPPAGRDPLGGEDIDKDIVDYLGQVLGDDDPEAWQRLCNPPDVAWRRNAASFLAEVQRAKETLSEVTVCQLWVPGLERDIQLTRTELDKLLVDSVDATADTLEAALRDAKVSSTDLAGVYLVGGSSRIPLVADTLWRRLGVRPSVQDNPKSVVAMGAATWSTAVPTAPTAPPVVHPSPPPTTPSRFRSPLAMATTAEAWPAGYVCTAQLTVSRLGTLPLRFRARNEPATVTSAQQLAQQVLAIRAPRTPGFRELQVGPAAVLGLADGGERRFLMSRGGATVAMFEQYAVIDGRAVVVAGPEDARPIAATLVRGSSPLADNAWFESRFELSLPSDWSVTEQVTLARRGNGHRVTSTCSSVPGGSELGSWRRGQLAPLMARAGARLISQTQGKILGVVDAEILTLGSIDQGTSLVTKLGVGTLAGLGLSVVITLPSSDQSMFPALVRHAWLHPDFVSTSPA